MRLEFEPNVATFPLVENEVFDELPTHEDLESLLNKGIAAAQKGDRLTARDYLMQAAEHGPQSEDAWMWLASISEYPEELLAFLDNVLSINPENHKAGEWHAATRSLLAKTIVERAAAACEAGSLIVAGQLIEDALYQDPNCEAAWELRLSMATTDEEREISARRILENDPENEAANEVLEQLTQGSLMRSIEAAKTAAAAGRPNEAIALLDEVIATSPSHVEALMLRVHFSSSIEEKLYDLEAVLKIDPENIPAKATYDLLRSTIEAKPRNDVTHQVEACLNEQEQDPHVTDDPLFVDLAPETGSDLEPEPAELPDPYSTVGQINVPDEVAEYVGETEVEDMDVKAAETVESYGGNVDEAFDAVEPAADLESVIAETVSGSTDSVVFEPSNELPCPFCSHGNEPQAFECGNCFSTLGFSDIESLLANNRVDRGIVQQAVTQMEAEWNLREFSVEELTALSVGHVNLRSFEKGLQYLQEASRCDPNNVILAGQVNTLAIRVDEIRRQDEVHGAMPKGKKILIVDDSATVRKLISSKLEKCGHHVVCAEDGVEALERLSENLPDLVLLDITMPRMDGYEVCKEIRSRPDARELPVVMISGKDGFFDKVRGRMAGTTGYVTKPFGPETLMKALDAYLVPDAQPAPVAAAE